MNTYRCLDILKDSLGNCIHCEVRKNCKLLKEVYQIDFCDVIRLIQNPSNFISREDK